jgi:perosamine synthetase
MPLPRFVAPAGTALNAGDLLTWLRGSIRPATEICQLAAAFRARYGVRHIFFVSSGRAGMTVLLRALAEARGGRDELLVPGYTCYSVAASAVRAGLSVHPVDISASTLDYEARILDDVNTDRAVALTSSSLYGIPADLPRLERYARDRGIAFVDDAAQCLDGQVDGRWAGTYGDAGLFSFDKGKNITTIQGGVVVCRDDELALRLGHAFRALPPPPPSRVASDGIKIMLYALLLRPRLYWLPNRLLSLGETPFDLDSPSTGYSPRLAPLARQLLARIAAITEGRVRTAAALRQGIGGLPDLVLPANPAARSVYARFPVLFPSASDRARVLDRLKQLGIGATASYPAPLIDVAGVRPHLSPALRDTPVARQVSERILTLPTHPYVTAHDISRIAGVVRSSAVLGDSGP